MKHKLNDQAYIKKWVDADGKLRTELRIRGVWEQFEPSKEVVVESELNPPVLDADGFIWGKER